MAVLALTTQEDKQEACLSLGLGVQAEQHSETLTEKIKTNKNNVEACNVEALLIHNEQFCVCKWKAKKEDNSVSQQQEMDLTIAVGELPMSFKVYILIKFKLELEIGNIGIRKEQASLNPNTKLGSQQESKGILEDAEQRIGKLQVPQDRNLSFLKNERLENI